MYADGHSGLDIFGLLHARSTDTLATLAELQTQLNAMGGTWRTLGVPVDVFFRPWRGRKDREREVQADAFVRKVTRFSPNDCYEQISQQILSELPPADLAGSALARRPRCPLAGLAPPSVLPPTYVRKAPVLAWRG